MAQLSNPKSRPLAEGKPKPGRAAGPQDPAAEPPDRGMRGAEPPACPPARGSWRKIDGNAANKKAPDPCRDPGRKGRQARQ